MQSFEKMLDRRHGYLVLLASTSCAVRTADNARPSPDGGMRDAHVVETPETGAPACPGVYAGKVNDSSRTDDGVEGLAALRARVRESRRLFDEYATANGNTYRYTRQFQSFTGYACEATIQVTNGAVSSITERTRPDRTSDVSSWSTPTTHGPDGGASCAPALTMDQLYDDCLDRALCHDPRSNLLYVTLDARGLLLQCGNVPMNCADDCFEGFDLLLLTADERD